MQYIFYLNLGPFKIYVLDAMDIYCNCMFISGKTIKKSLEVHYFLPGEKVVITIIEYQLCVFLNAMTYFNYVFLLGPI